ncbi:MAG: phospholipid carrier-dependent glycosyltransferase [Candidatus Omnitrophica bacterium]|nr:phospholipid carrier-dependent glycosyltransferase [Candidatus Omnitrophota bacterium]
MNWLLPSAGGDCPSEPPAWLMRSLLGLFLVGCLLGAASVWCRYFIFTDGAVYAALGRNLATGVGLKYGGATHLFYPPGYPIAIAVLFSIVRDAEMAAHLASYFAYLGTILLTIRLAWSLRPSPLFTLLSGFIVVFHPYMILYASYALSESLFAFAVIASAYCAWKLAGKRSSPLWLWGLWGILGGFLYLIRADGIVYWPLQAAFLLWSHRKAVRPFILRAAASAFLMLLVMSPYLHLIKQETGKWQLSTKTSILLEFSRMKMQDDTARGETRQTSRLSEDGKTFAIDRSRETLGGFLRDHPGEAMQRILWNAGRLIRRPGLAFSWPSIILLVFLGFLLKKRLFQSPSIFLLLHALPIGLFLVFYVEDRFLLPFIPFFAIAYARAGEQLFDLARLHFNKRIWMASVSLILIFSLGAAWTARPRLVRIAQRVFPSNLPLEHKQMGIWMKENLPISADVRITHRNPWVSFYAGGCHARTPDFDVNLSREERTEKLVHWCREVGVRYIVIDERMTLPNMPGLGFLLEEDQPHHGLRWIKTIEDESSPKIVLYALQNDS